MQSLNDIVIPTKTATMFPLCTFFSSLRPHAIKWVPPGFTRQRESLVNMYISARILNTYKHPIFIDYIQPCFLRQLAKLSPEQGSDVWSKLMQRPHLSC
jgi:hypothetical protein